MHAMHAMHAACCSKLLLALIGAHWHSVALNSARLEVKWVKEVKSNPTHRPPGPPPCVQRRDCQPDVDGLGWLVKTHRDRLLICLLICLLMVTDCIMLPSLQTHAQMDASKKLRQGTTVASAINLPTHRTPGCQSRMLPSLQVHAKKDASMKLRQCTMPTYGY